MHTEAFIERRDLKKPIGLGTYVSFSRVMNMEMRQDKGKRKLSLGCKLGESDQEKYMRETNGRDGLFW